MASPPPEEQLPIASGGTAVHDLAAHGDGYASDFTDPPPDLGGPAMNNIESCYASEIVSTHEVMDDDEHDAEYYCAAIEGIPDEEIDESDEDIDEYEEAEYDEDDTQWRGTDSETNCPGKNYSKEEVGEIVDKWLYSFTRQFDECLKVRKVILARGDKNARLPTYPLKVLPEVTHECIDGRCYHREYMTHDTSTTASILGYRKPKSMLQVFSLRLASYESYPVSVYGIFAVRDDLEPRRNLIFNCPRDAAVTIDKDFFTLPLCSPSRGMHVLDHALLEVDLWVKKDGDGSADKKLLSAYVEIYVQARFDLMRTGQISSDSCSLEIDYMFLSSSVEAVIQVYSKVDHPHHLRFTAFSSGFDHEIVLFGDKCVGNGNINQHVVVVKQKGKLEICLKLEKHVFQWTFQDGVAGTISSPGNSVFEYGQFFVRVLFAPKNTQARPKRPSFA
ncbi:uncharacterized protein [Lolium perenne]|uniref:uncharacterized protein n=1 Tax=Lolium perenne TaxID=4522 RepID=UPI003A99F243